MTSTPNREELAWWYCEDMCSQLEQTQCFRRWKTWGLALRSWIAWFCRGLDHQNASWSDPVVPGDVLLWRNSVEYVEWLHVAIHFAEGGWIYFHNACRVHTVFHQLDSRLRGSVANRNRLWASVWIRKTNETFCLDSKLAKCVLELHAGIHWHALANVDHPPRPNIPSPWLCR